ncbi:hypothetical protein PVK06_008986 [Gossypium arboreum]|uniref:Aminotransferase-like plant mobile domain-containing protein n=1 Tax=Gossypium arboreum TaxID=29729 RepID=A0ABR0QM48_GOSAR|nr:hypothetical protein PVK06_008986 [Gossypium arboreum]
MVGELIRLDHKHISVEQMKMSVDWVLQCYIRNMFGLPSPLIENYLRDAGFWHVANIGLGCKLDPKLISAFIEMWRPKMHTFHLPYRDCTITLEVVQLQLGLLVDGSILTESFQSADWGAICYDLLGVIPDNIYRGQIEMGWLRDTFPEPGDDSTEVKRIRYARSYIIEIIGGYLTPDLSRNLIHLRCLLKLVDFKAADELSWGSSVLVTLYQEMYGATKPNKAKIRGCLSLLQSWARFRFLFLHPRVNHPYTFPLITSTIHDLPAFGLYNSLLALEIVLPNGNMSPVQLRSGNSNVLSVDRSIFCMWAGGEYAVNHESSSSSFEPPSSSSGLVGIGSDLKNNTTSTLSGPGSRDGSTSDLSSNPSSSVTYEVPSPVDVV